MDVTHNRQADRQVADPAESTCQARHQSPVSTALCGSGSCMATMAVT